MKRIMSLLLALVMVVGTSATAFAAEPQESKKTTAENKVEQLVQEYGISTFDLDTRNVQEMLVFDSFSDFEKFVKETVEQPKEIEATINVNESAQVNARDLNSNHVITWWAPFSGWGMTGIACWRNVAFNYSYKYVNGYPRFTSCSNITSYLSGINVTTWSQKSSSYNFVTQDHYHDKVKINVKGVYILGVTVEGFNIGVTIPGEWNASLKLNKV